MIRYFSIVLIILLAVLSIGAAAAYAEYVINVQGAAVYTEKNDVQVPGDTGTRFSLCDNLQADTAFAGRLEAGYVHKNRDYFGIVIAPLSVDSHGSVNEDINFTGTIFPANTDLDATFRFDSYRITWRRKLVAKENLDLWLGLTGKIRDAAITVEGGGRKAEKDNTGFVPLINFLMDWRFAKPWTIRVSGDALAAPQGRAEDVLFALMYDASASTKVFAGYRVLEGGADNDEVYTFSLFNYIVGGVEVRF